MSSFRGLFCLCLFIMLFPLTGCSSDQLSFSTLNQAGDASYSNTSTELVVIATQDELNKLMASVVTKYPLDAKAENVDFDQNFILLVLRGRTLSGYAVTVQKVRRVGSEVSIYAEFKKPDPDQLILPASASPYHLISVSKKGQWDQDIRFTLLDTAGDEPQTVLQVTHFIPTQGMIPSHIPSPTPN